MTGAEPADAPASDSSEGAPEPVRVRVDRERCIGSGTCEMLEEETFLIDDDSVVAAVIGDGLLPSDRAAAVADRCPGKAIIVEAVDAGADTEAVDADGDEA